MVTACYSAAGHRGDDAGQGIHHPHLETFVDVEIAVAVEGNISGDDLGRSRQSSISAVTISPVARVDGDDAGMRIHAAHHGVVDRRFSSVHNRTKNISVGEVEVARLVERDAGDAVERGVCTRAAVAKRVCLSGATYAAERCRWTAAVQCRWSTFVRPSHRAIHHGLAKGRGKRWPRIAGRSTLRNGVDKIRVVGSWAGYVRHRDGLLNDAARIEVGVGFPSIALAAGVAEVAENRCNDLGDGVDVADAGRTVGRVVADVKPAHTVHGQRSAVLDIRTQRSPPVSVEVLVIPSAIERVTGKQMDVALRIDTPDEEVHAVG